MRDLLFKNLTSDDRKKRVIASSEITDKQGVRSIVQRHLICVIKEVSSDPVEKPLPYLYVLKEHNTKEHREKFFCRIKGSLLVANKNKLFLVLFMHSLKINLISIKHDPAALP
jgi:hypothetical protein